MKRAGALLLSLSILLMSGAAHADCTGIKFLDWKATGSVYATAVVKIANTSKKAKTVYILCRHNDGKWYKILGEKIKIEANSVVEKEVKTGATWTTIIDAGISSCE